MNRRRVVYPLLVAALAALVWWFDRAQTPERKPVPRSTPVPYQGTQSLDAPKTPPPPK